MVTSNAGRQTTLDRDVDGDAAVPALGPVPLRRRNAEGSEPDWVRAHQALALIGRRRARCDADEGRWLLCAWRSAAHIYAGFGSFAEYVERLLGYGPRLAHDKLRVARALERLPRLADALAAGTLHWSAIRALIRVAAPHTEEAWLAAATGKSVRDVEALTARASPGAPPDAPATSPQRHLLRFEVTPETLATFRSAMNRLRQSSDRHLDDDAALLAMARAVLEGPSDTGRASYQLSLSLCPACGNATQNAGTQTVSVGPHILAMATCDAQFIGSVPPPAPGDAQPSATAPFERSAPREPAPPAEPTPTLDASALGQPPSLPLRPRAKQSIPPAIRRQVFHRDQHRCRIPGCHNATFLDVHHIRPRSEGGAHATINLILLCGAHHRAVHSGMLLLHGSAQDLRVRHADGRPYGKLTHPHAADAYAKVFSALRQLGFRERDARTVLDELRKRASAEAPTVEGLLRWALERIRPGAARDDDRAGLAWPVNPHHATSSRTAPGSL